MTTAESRSEEQPGSDSSQNTDPADAQMMGLLQEHVPVSLLMDLSAPTGPESEVIIEEEGGAEDDWWEQSP